MLYNLKIRTKKARVSFKFKGIPIENVRREIPERIMKQVIHVIQQPDFEKSIFDLDMFSVQIERVQ